MIALGGPRRFRVGRPNVSGEPEDIPWLLILRSTRVRLLPGLFAWPMVVGSAFATLAFCLPGRPDEWSLGIVWPVVVFQPFVVIAFGNAAVGSATGLPRWLRRHHSAEDFLMLPVPGPAWAAAQARLFAVSAAWGIGAFLLPFMPMLFKEGIRRSGGMILVFGLIIGVAAALNWVLYWARIVGGRARWISALLLWAFYPAVYFGFATSRNGLVSSVLEGYTFHFAFLGLCVATGLAGMRRSAREYPDILRRRLFP